MIDFGGALGTSYHQSRHFLEHLQALEWCVVEQPHFVECGRQEFQAETLRFEADIESCAAEGRPQVVLFSGVLQYLPDPVKELSPAVDTGAEYIVLDRTPVIRGRENQLAVEIVPRRFGRASYPVWLFSPDHLLAPLGAKYRVVNSFAAAGGVMDHGFKRVEFKGYILARC